MLRLAYEPSGGLNAQIWSYLGAACAMFEADQAILYQQALGGCQYFSHRAGERREALRVGEGALDAQLHGLMCLKSPKMLVLSPDITGNLPGLAYTPDGVAERHSLVAPLPATSAVLLLVRREDSGIKEAQLHAQGDRAGQTGQLTAQDSEVLSLLAEGVARMVQLNASPDKILRAQEGFAVAGIRSLPEYVELASLPAVFGVPGRVMDSLSRRVGQSSLSIDDIASELSMSKRTLQRRLQQAEINFAMLRDQVRFHYAIGYLVDQNLSVDQISNALDFSDRTSFTNAFKRWTGLSPSTFRKLFRDYA